MLIRGVVSSPVRGVVGSGFGGARRLLFDDFHRDNTLAGVLGDAPTGQTWDLRGVYAGSYPLPAATDGQIVDNTFQAPAGQVVYAGMDLGETVRRLECDWSWVDDTVGTAFTTLALIISPSPNWIDTMLHITITNGVCNIQKRVAGGSFVTMNTGKTTISPSLALANTVHTAQIFVIGDRARVVIDDRYDVTVQDAEIPSIVGRYIVAEHYSATTDVRWPMKVRRVEAFDAP